MESLRHRRTAFESSDRHSDSPSSSTNLLSREEVGASFNGVLDVP